MSVRYTEGARVFISMVLIALVIITFFLAFLVTGNYSPVKTQLLPEEEKSISCGRNGYIRSVGEEGVDVQLGQMHARSGDSFCLEKTGAHRWSIYASHQ